MIIVKHAFAFLTILSIFKIVLMLPMVPDNVMENANELQQNSGKILFLRSVTSITILHFTVFEYNIYNMFFSF